MNDELAELVSDDVPDNCALYIIRIQLACETTNHMLHGSAKQTCIGYSLTELEREQQNVKYNLGLPAERPDIGTSKLFITVTKANNYEVATLI